MLQETPAKGSDPVLLAHLERLLQAFGPMSVEAGAPAGDDRLVEPLSRKELQVLNLVAEGCSNGAIAER